MLIWYDLVWNNNLGYVRLNGSYNILKSINFQVAGIPSLCKEKNMNVKSMSYTGKGKVLWTVWELDAEDYEILFHFKFNFHLPCFIFLSHSLSSLSNYQILRYFINNKHLESARQTCSAVCLCCKNSFLLSRILYSRTV